MSQITIGSFGEQTLDALLDAENISQRKESPKRLKKTTRNTRFQKSNFIPLRGINENLASFSEKKVDDERVTRIDDTNIDKYFQDSIILSKVITQASDIVDISKKNDGTGLKKVISRNKESLRNKQAKSFKKLSTKTSKFKKQCIKSLDKDFIIESSEDEASNKPQSSKRTDFAISNHKRPRNIITSNYRSLDCGTSVDNKSDITGKESNKTNYVQLLSIDKTAIDVEIGEITSGRKFNELKEIESSTKDKHIDSVASSGTQCSTVCTQDRCKLSAWGLPPDILQIYQSRGMGMMFPWQVECLSNYQVLEENKNLVYSAPTSAGKTLVAEMLVIKTVLERHKKVIIILPFVSVVREKMFYFQDLLSSSGIRVEGFMGGIAPAGGLAATHIAIATIEKANSLINRLMEEEGLSSLGAVVIDELHLLGDSHRGYLLELLLTKLKYMTLREEHIKIQLIGMSATLPNLSLLAEWLDAELFSTDFRPVPLNEQYKVSSIIYNNKFAPIRELHPSPELPNDSDHILQLSIETIAGGHSTLIFCPTKNWCEKLAHQVAAVFFKLGSGGTALGKILREQLNPNAIEETLSQLKRCPAGLDNVLKSTVSFGVAFHHAGLTMDERDIIEGSFRTGSLRVLIATSTLSSGVNLPARRVIVRSLMFHGKVIDILTYKQMIGRAGRMGKDTAGESILICKPNEKKAAESLLSAPLDPVESCLDGSGPLIRALLEAVASKIACTSSDIDLYSRCTLASYNPDSNMPSLTKEAMEFLTLNEFIIVQETKEKEERWVATALGRACLASSVSPRDGLFLFEELQRARKCFVLETELHIIYLVTPFNSGGLNGQIDWMIFFNLWKSLSQCERRVGQMVGIEERFLMLAIKGIVKEGKQHDVHKRFFTALALQDLVREIPLTTVAEKYGCSRGILQSLQQSASTFAGMVTQFCKQLGWDCMELLFHQFQARLQFGVCRELLDLLRLPMLNGLRARSLYKEGIQSVADLAVADELSVERALHRALPFESEKEQDGEHVIDAARRNKVRSIFVTGRDGLTPYQAAVLLVQEARTLVQHELGVKGVNWKEDNSTRAKNSNNTNNSSVIRDPDSSLARNGTSIHLPKSDKSSGSPPKGNTNYSRNINGMSKLKVDLLDVQPVKTSTISSAISAVITERLPNEIERVENKFDETWTGIKEIVKKIDSAEDQRGKTIREENVLNKTARNKLKFDLLGKKQKTLPKNNSTESILGDDDERIVDESVVESSLKTSGDPLRCEKRARNSDTSFGMKNDIPNTKIRERGENIGEIVTEKRSPPKILTTDLKLNISPVVTLEWLSFDEILSNKKSSNDLTKDPELEKSPIQSEDKLLSNDQTKVSLTESPSLFGDSFCVDTQLCDELEKNISSSLDISKVIETERPATANRLSSKLQKSIDLNDEVSSPEIFIKQVTNTSGKKFSFDVNTTENRLVNKSYHSKNPDSNSKILNSEEINFSWNSTTWDGLKDSRNSLNMRDNACDEAVDHVAEEEAPLNLENRFSEEEMGNQMTLCDLNNRSNRIAVTPMIQNSRFKSMSSKSNVKNLGNMKLVNNSDSRKRKFNEVHSMSDSSPVLNVLNSSNNRRLSFESNKSDSDDLIVASQNFETLKSNIKNRTRRKLESSKRAMTDKKQSNLTLAESGRQSNIIKNQNIELLRTGDASAKKVSYDENCSTDSIVSNSEEDSPVRRLRVTQSLHKRTLNSSFIVQKIENLRKCKKRCLRSTVQDEKSNSDRTLDWNVLDIINVTWNDKIFNLFSSELKQKNEIALALAHDKFVNDTAGIGSKLIGRSDTKKKFQNNETCVFSNTIVHGVAISWGRNVVYYISLENRKEGSILLKDRLQLLRDILTDSSLNVRCYGSKEVYKKLYQCCSIACNCRFLDPKVAEWLLEPENNERNLHDMAKIYFPEGATILHHTDSIKTAAGTSLENKEFLLGRHRAATEAAVTWHVMGKLTEKLQVQSKILFYAFEDVETRVASTLARMELTGIGINLESLQELSVVLQKEIASLEQQAYSLAGRKFSFTSSKEVAQVLGMYKGIKVSTNKAVLESCDNPISNLVMSWRKLNTTQTKMVFPLLNLAQQSSRIRGCCVTRTATGRVSMHEPNLQNVPRDFSSRNNSFVISMRMAFVPTCGKIMLSADYCQLELRILAHFSKDPVLCDIMKKDSDIFKSIAAQWNHITVEEVKDDIRQRTKQLCYGIIYGMGSKSLAKQLSVTELEANQFMETFMGTYPNVNNWLNQVVTQSREKGYVTTLMERRRMLPGLNSAIKSEQSQAERQAVNTKIQGSAADLAKKAMVLIDEKLHEEYPDSPRILSEMKTKKLRSSKDSQNRGAYLVLQLHDELLYEVNAVDLDRVASIVKQSMEKAYELLIPLPVKIKVGPTWGSLEEYLV